MATRKPRALKAKLVYSYLNEDAYQRASAVFLLGPLVVTGVKITRSGKETKVYERNRRFGVLRWDVMAYHTPNGGSRNKIEASKLRGMGTLAGVADWTLFWSDHVGVRLGFIELKHAEGDQHDSQLAFEAECKRHGIPYHVCRNDLRPIYLALLEMGVPLSPVGIAWG